MFDGADDISIEGALGRAWMAQEADAIHAGISVNAPNWGENLDVPVMEDWLKERGYDFNKVFDESHPEEGKRVCLAIWLESIGEKVKDAKNLGELEKLADEVSMKRRLAAPVYGSQIIYRWPHR